MDPLELIAALPGTLTVGGKTYPVHPPTPGDMLREALQMKQLARATGRKDPLKYIAENANLLSPAALAEAVREAVRVGTAPAPEPDRSGVQEQYGLPDGVRWRVWYHLNRSGHAITEEDAKAMVTDFNCGNLCVALDTALCLPELGEKKEPGQPTGTTG